MFYLVSPPPVISDAVWIALISAVVGPAVLLILGFFLNRKINHLRDDTKATRHQVENDHSTNMRVENDERHDELVTLVETVISAQKTQGKDISGIRSELRALRTDDADQRQRILDLERKPNHSKE